MDNVKRTTLMAYVFIARDDSEYRRYSFSGEMDMPSKQKDELCQWRYSHDTKSLRLILNKKGIGLHGWKYLSPPTESDPCNGTLWKNMDSLQMAKGAREREPLKKEIEKQCAELFGADGHIIKKLKQIKNLLCKIDLGESRPLLMDDPTISGVLFIHWGGDQYDFYENTVKAYLPEGWGVFSVGTGRNHLFHVDATPIKIPYDVDGLCKKFEMAKGNDIKNILTRLAIDGSSGNEKEMVVNFLLRSDVRIDLRAASSDSQMKWLRDWNAFREYLNDENKKETDENKIGTRNHVLSMLDDRDKVRALAAQLLSVPQLLSEGVII